MGAWLQHVRSRDVAALNRSPLWVQRLYVALAVLVLGGIGVGLLRPTRPDSVLLASALQAALTHDDHGALVALVTRLSGRERSELWPSGVRLLDFDKHCVIRSSEASAVRRPVFGGESEVASGAADLTLRVRDLTLDVRVPFTWRWARTPVGVEVLQLAVDQAAFQR